jgi:hypothetical protein
MREVVIQSWCDECASTDTSTIGEAIDIHWNGRDYSLDLCEKHAAPFHDVDRLISTYAHPQGKRPAPKKVSGQAHSSGSGKSAVHRLPNGYYQCPECERTFNNAQGWGSHRRQTHNTGS